MKKIQKFLLSVRFIWVFFYLFSPVVFAQEAKVETPAPAASPLTPANDLTTEPNYILCRFDKSVRTVRVMNDSSGCSTFYTKSGVDRKVGGSKSLSVCINVLKSIKSNLESGNWKCKDISTSAVSEPAPTSSIEQ